MKITCFEDIDCWKEARQLVNSVYRVCSVKEFKKDYSLYVAMDQGYISNIEFKEIYEQADKIQR